MKFRKTLKFMVQNPPPLFFYFLVCWILFSALATMSDDPFIYGALPEAGEEIEDSVENLPWSLWKLFTALSLLIEEIAHDFSHVEFGYVLVPALIIGYIESRGSIKGINNERKEWMAWYSSQLNAKTQSDSDKTPSLPKGVQAASYPKLVRETTESMLRSPMRLLVHFTSWIIAFASIAIILKINNGIVGSLQYFFKSLPQFVIPAAILALLSSYRETRGFLKGITAERRVWMGWYNRQHAAIKQGNDFEEPPSQEQVRLESYFKTAGETVVFMLRNSKSFFIRFMSWGFVIPLLFIVSAAIFYGNETFPLAQDLVGILLQLYIPLAIFAVIISYREARGTLKGIALEQQVWNSWYTQQQAIGQEDSFKVPPSSENNASDSYLKTVQKVLILVLKKPYIFLLHLIYWISGFVLVYGITDLLAIEGLPDFMQILLVFILAFISTYQETKGNLNGTKSQRQVWMEWYNRQLQAEEEIQLTDSPSMLEVC